MSTPTPEIFLTVFQALFEEGQGSINSSTEFRKLEEWSSMQALIVIAAVDENFGVTLPEKEFRNAKTVEDLFELTRSRFTNA